QPPPPPPRPRRDGNSRDASAAEAEAQAGEAAQRRLIDGSICQMTNKACAIVALALCLAALPARADENEAKAKALYKSGVAHYEKGEYKAAVRDLLAADDLVHSPALAYN